jgi:hypothetical protein
MWQYSTFLSRAVYGNEDNGMATREEIQDSESNGAFLREAAVALSVRALTSYYWRDTTYGNLTTAGWLCNKGVFTAEQFDDAALRVLPSALFDEDGKLVRKTALVTVATCPEEGLTPITASLEIDGDRVFAYKLGEGTVCLYELDYKTLSVNAMAELPAEEGFLRLEYVASFEETDYFVEHLSSDMGTKCGALLGEAVVIPDPKFIDGFRSLIKQRGGLLAKGRLLGIQFDALFTDDLYFKLSEHAIRLAMKIKKGFEDKGYDFMCVSATNQQFPILSYEQIERLKTDFSFDDYGPADENHRYVRFCTSWATTEENVNKLLEAI